MGLARSPTSEQIEVSRLSSREPCALLRDLQGVLPMGGSQIVPNGHYRVALGLHVFVQSWPVNEVLGEAPSTDKEEVEVFPHMA